MEEKKNRNIRLILTGLVLVAILVVSIGSYAYWQLTKKQEGKNIVGTACLNISYEEDTSHISLYDVWPTDDAVGQQNDPYTFTITNNCDEPVNYLVAMESLYDEGKSDGDYLDYNYVRVKLDDDMAQTYGLLNSIPNDNPNGYSIRDTKELIHLTLGGHESVTHSVRIWLYGNTPLQNIDGSYNTSKYFFGKIRVTAGQNIEGSDTDVIGIVGSGDIDTVGTEVQIGREHFYVIGDDHEISGNVRLLAKYNLLVGIKDVRYEEMSSSECDSAGGAYDSKESRCYFISYYSSLNRWYNRQSSDSLGMHCTMNKKAVIYATEDESTCKNYGGIYEDKDDVCYIITDPNNTSYDYIEELGGEPDYSGVYCEEDDLVVSATLPFTTDDRVEETYCGYTAERKYVKYEGITDCPIDKETNDCQQVCMNNSGNWNGDNNTCEFTEDGGSDYYDHLSLGGVEPTITSESYCAYENHNTRNDFYWADYISVENYQLKDNYTLQGSQVAPYVYRDNSQNIDSKNLIAPYVNNYKDILEARYNIVVSDARLLSLEEAIELGCQYDADQKEYVCPHNISWLFNNISYWLGSAENGKEPRVFGFNVDHGDELDSFRPYSSISDIPEFGVRPVISVSKSIFEGN